VQKSLLAPVEKMFPADGAKTAREQLDLANRMMQAAGQLERPPAERFVLLRRAAELACDAGEVTVMLQAGAVMDAGFQLDGMDFQRKMLAHFLAGAADAATMKPGVEASLQLAQRAADEDRNDLADEVLQQAFDACRKSQFAALRKEVRARQVEMQKLAKQLEQFDAAMETLKTSPDDPQANLTVGRWHCFQKWNAEQGWPHLAKASDESLRRLAAQELSPPAGAEAQVKLADAWFSLAQSRSAAEREGMLIRAGVWYQRAWESLPAGVAKARAEKRLDEIVRPARPAAKAALGRLGVGGESMLWHLKPGDPFPRKGWVDLLEHAVLTTGGGQAGQWTRTDDGIVGNKTSGVLLLPLTVDGDYDMELELSRQLGTDTIFVVFLVGQRQCTLKLCFHFGDEHSLSVSESLLPNPPQPIRTHVTPGDLSNGPKHTVLLQVRLTGDNATVAAQLDKEPLVYWAGPQVKVEPGVSAAEFVLQPGRFNLASFSAVTFHSVRLRVLSGKAVLFANGG
jgi:hypothetical protein